MTDMVDRLGWRDETSDKNPRAHELAQKIAESRNVSMTEAVIDLLEAEVRRQMQTEADPLPGDVAAIVAELHAKARPGGHDMSKDEIAKMWGHN